MFNKGTSSLALPSLAGAYFALGVASLAVIGLAEPIGHDLGVSKAMVAQLVTLFSLTYAVAAPALQMWIGGWDRRLLIITGLTGIALGAVLGAVAQDFVLLAASRVVMALGGALVGPMASASGAGLVTPERRGAALGFVFSGMTIATVLGVPLASWLGTLLSWRIVLVLIGGLALAAALAVRVTTPGGMKGERTTARALTDVFGDRAVMPAIGATLLQMAAQFVTYAVIGTYLVSVQDISRQMIPVALLVFGVGGIAGNVIAARLVARMGANRMIVISLAALAAIFGGMAGFPHQAGMALGLLGLWAVVAMMMMAPQQMRLVELAPQARNLVLALNASALYVGMAAGAAVGAVVLNGAGAEFLPLVSALITGVAILCHIRSSSPAPALAQLWSRMNCAKKSPSAS